MSGVTACVLDPTVLRELEGLGVDLGQDVLGEVVKAFEETAPPLIAALGCAARDGDVLAARRAAHTLRSASLQVGARRLYEIAVQIGAEARSGGPELVAFAEMCAAELALVQQALVPLRSRKP